MLSGIEIFNFFVSDHLNKVKAFEPVPFSADRIVLRSYRPATILSLLVTVSFYSI